MDDLQTISKIFQNSYGVVPGKRNEIQKYMKIIESTKTREGIYLLTFIGESKCKTDVEYRKVYSTGFRRRLRYPLQEPKIRTYSL